MTMGLLGRKVGMTQIFDEAGTAIPVTVIQAGPCNVLQLRTKERDGYEAVQVGFLDKPRRLASRSERGHVAKLESRRSKLRAKAGLVPSVKADSEPKRYIREFRTPVESYTIGQELTVGLFSEIKAVDVTGTSKGRGTAGVMRRHNFSGQRASHGVKKVHRHGGGTGQNTFPARTFKGKRMAGRWGAEKVTSRNLRVVRVDGDNSLLLIRGAVPGPNGGYLYIRPTNTF
ncbi:MAG: 50S ribosomal protein L3 [Planctomycetota bacterium]|nr:50S ribosomal protein L3 [Planctomycetota bacterium]